MRFSSISARSLLLLAAIPFASAHSWIEELMVIAPNGTYVGQPGYPRANQKDHADTQMVYLIPIGGPSRGANDIRPADPICRPEQTTPTQTPDSPRLQAAAGSMVALKYLENGHVTNPKGFVAGKPANRGTNFVYGTTQSKPDDSFMSIHRQWTPDGKGGDGRGVLLSTQNYDDGQCYQINEVSTAPGNRSTVFPNNGQELPCQQDILLPSTLKGGDVYTLYWVWDWPTMAGQPGAPPEGKQEIYTTCMDIDIIDSPANPVVSKNVAVNFAAGQALNNAGIPAQLKDISNPTAVTSIYTIPFPGAPSGTPSGQASAVNTPPPVANTPAPTSFNVQPIPPQTTAPATPQSPPQPPSVGGSRPGVDQNGGGSGIAPVSGKNDTTPPGGLPMQAPPGRPSGPCPSRFASGSPLPTDTPTGSTATAIQPNQPMSTVTEYDVLTQTIYQTVQAASKPSPIPTQSTSTFTDTTFVTTTVTVDGPPPTSTIPIDAKTTSSASARSASSSSSVSVPQAAPLTGLFVTSASLGSPLPTYTAPASAALTISAVTPPPPGATVKARAEPSCSRQHSAFRLRARLPFAKNVEEGC